MGSGDESSIDLRSVVKQLSRTEAEDFVYQEVRLLDERRFEEWLELFTKDGLYWIPMVDGADPENEPSVLYDDSITRRQRVYQLLHQPHYSQMPPSRTTHFVSNVEIHAGDKDDTCVIHCNVAIFELRPGDPRQSGLGDQRSFIGHGEYHLQSIDNHWRIALKKVIMMNRDLPLENISFIL